MRIDAPVPAGTGRALALRWRIAALTILVATIGGGLRVMTVHRPFSHQLTNAWREADYVQIARNFDREGMNILYPRIDWRGDTPGFVEMELPLTPWLAAAGYRLFGYHEQFLRILSAAFSLAGLLVFLAIARDLLRPVAALIAFAAFALNPLLVRLSGSMQPEPLMMLFVLLAAYHALRFDRTGRTRSLLLAAASTALAALAKAPGATVGLLLAVACLRRYGCAAPIKPTVLAAASVAVLPPIFWYRWAGRFWREYGNSLGLSNESHWLNVDLLRHPYFILGNFKAELLLVWTPVGFLLLFAAWRARARAWPALWWYAAALVFYIAAAGTSGDEWAAYYHCISVPPVCLLIGIGVQSIRQSPRRHRAAAPAVVVATLGLLVAATFIGVYRRDHDEDLAHLAHCAHRIKHLVPPQAMIVVRGGRSVDEFSRPVAYNEPMLFAWLDRRGFNYAKDRLSIAELNQIADHGGRYWIARRSELEDADAADRLPERFTACGTCDCGDLIVFDLRRPAATLVNR